MDSKPVVLRRYRNGKKLSQKRLEQLVGRWETEGRDSPAVLEIAIKNGRAIVTGFDSTDGERFRVSGVRWDGKSLMFTTYMPSSRHRVWHRFIYLRRGLVTHELLYAERWERVPTDEPKAETRKKGWGAPQVR
jgi:hypothetical protein